MWSSATKSTVKGPFSLFWTVACVSPASNTAKLTAEVGVAANAVATTVIPVLTGTVADAVIQESGTTIWTHGAYVAGAPGITGAVVRVRCDSGCMCVWRGVPLYCTTEYRVH